MKKNKKWIPGVVISAIMAIVVVAFLVIVTMSQMLPGKYLTLIGAAIVLVAAGAGVGTAFLLVRKKS